MINKISLDLTKNIPTRPALIFGMENENNSSFLEIKLPYSLVDKWLYIEFSTSECEPFTTPRLTAQNIDGNAILVYGIDNPITQYLGFGKMQVVAKNASGLVWKSSVVDYIIKNSINATEQIVESKPDVIADLQRQIDEIGEGGGSETSGSNSSGIYVVTQDLALQGTSSTPLDSVLVGEKELQVGDILTDNKGTIAKVSLIEETTVTSGGSVGESTIVVVNYEVVSNQEIPQDLLNKIDNALSTAQGKIKGISYYDLTAMVIDLLSYDNQKLKVPDIIKLKQTNVPDYWVSEVYDTYHDYTYVSDEQTILDISNGIPIGYYALAESETKTIEVSNNYTDLENKPTINGVELSGNKTSADLKLGMQTASGGFQGGMNAKVLSGKGVALGNGANTTNGGGAVGESAISQYSGAAVGQQAKETGGGGAIGRQANTVEGGSVGLAAKSKNGFAGGRAANSRYAPDGTTEISGAVAIGYSAKAQANNAIQLGTGINDEENTMKVGDYTLLDENGKIPTERLPEGIGGDENAFTSLASGQPIEKIVFNPNVSIEKMTNYLSGLTYDREISGIPSICNLVDLMGWYGEANASNGATFLHVYAIDFSALNAIVPNTSGYGIAVCETLNENLVLKQAVFATEYNEANVTLINAIKDPNYVLNYTKAGWGDTNDYNVSTYIGTTNGDYTIQSITVFNVYDNKVSAFIGRDSRFFEVVEMLDNDTELKEFTATLVTNTKANITKLAKIIHTAKGAIRIEASGAVVNLMGGYFNNSQGDSSIVVSHISSGGEYGISIVTTEAYSYNNNAYTRTNTVQIRTDKTVPTVTNSKAAVTIQITYYNDVEITA